MKSVQITSIGKTIVRSDLQSLLDIKPHVVFAFSSSINLGKVGVVNKVSKEFPDTVFLGCSTSGEVSGDKITNGAVVLTAMHFDDSSAKVVPFAVEFKDASHSFEAGKTVGSKIDVAGLKGVFILAPGLGINATDLVDGITAVIGSGFPIAGGLAGDGTEFKETRTILNGRTSNHQIVGFALYGEKTTMSSGYRGGWQPMGEPMQVTGCDGNVITFINKEPALDVYRRLLGEDAKNLPDSSLNYPFLILDNKGSDVGIVRTPLGVDKVASSLVLGGTVSVGSWMKLLRTDTKSLVQAANEAVESVTKKMSSHKNGLALVVSCVGRKVVMRDQTVKEIDEVKRLLGETNMVSGFYSYGELSPDQTTNVCRLHNQTLTLTYFSDVG